MRPGLNRIASAAPDAHRDLVRGLFMVAVAMVLLPVQDAIVKVAAATVPVGEINWLRFVLQSSLTLPFLLLAHGTSGLVPNRLWPNVVRGAMIATSSGFMFMAVKFMPLADALAIFFVSPFILTILSALFGGEHVGWRRRLGVLAGFIGALIVIRPSYSVFGGVALLPLGCAAVFALYAFMTRRYASYDHPLTMQFTAGVSAALITSGTMIFGAVAGIAEFTPRMLDLREILLLLLMGFAGTFGHLLVVKSARHVPGSLFAPFQYLEIVAATILGYALFGDFPDALKWLGIGIIVGSGLYVFWRESRTR